ncbi:hypothetical protein ACAW74_20880 [Fibrella sp. WM1]|uniref:hypothetical protein n=1 Tax=Fibrella musci TaxID=3242485 RepID=UPI003521B431
MNGVERNGFQRHVDGFDAAKVRETARGWMLSLRKQKQGKWSLHKNTDTSSAVILSKTYLFRLSHPSTKPLLVVLNGPLCKPALMLPVLFLLTMAPFQAKSAAPLAVNQNHSDRGPALSPHATDTLSRHDVREEASRGQSATIRLEIPFSINGQSMTLSSQILYDADAQTVKPLELFLYGPGAPDEQTNYVSPVADYNVDGSIEFIGNLGFQYKTPHTRALVEREGAAVTLSAGPKTQLVSDHSQQQPYTLYPVDILYVRFTIDSKAGRGHGEVQVGGTKGPIYKYRITPQ